MLSAISFNLDHSKILSSGNGLIWTRDQQGASLYVAQTLCIHNKTVVDCKIRILS